MTTAIKKRALSFWIHYKRKGMYKKAKQFGFTHPKVVSHSQDLDNLLNKYQNIASH
ncbi:aspartyl-phosphate phosphatase Spo0E family protein [Sporosarcina sp. HYO08]|uniref:aspartyl-phosphate phosphatase Spo0E family protein n=1 Tax=Sporosarcina sp. HYO08 TaxID=1759557 RepID=UPI0020A60762|nr:aspartyl-phosphate phosphatase Spo0E family protein [Sporosarcina sp. HYO08]